MRFKIDENLPTDVCDLFRAAGHDVSSVFEQRLGGHPDHGIASVCQSEQRALVTLDTDFGNILSYPPETFPGIIVIRADDQSKPAIFALVQHIVTALQSTPVNRRLWVVERNRIRVRGEE